MNRKTFFLSIADKLTVDDLNYVQNAYWLVKDAHRRQKRRLTGERYFEHVRRVAHMAAVTFGFMDKNVIALSLLHDVIEDTFVSPNIIISLFGHHMYSDCLSLSKELPFFNGVTGEMIFRSKRSEEEYYQNLAKSSDEVKIVKGIDRIDNLADLPHWEEARREKYELETRKYILPIVSPVSKNIADEIERRLDWRSSTQQAT